jgi:two-component system sensor histidine kinase TctE
VALALEAEAPVWLKGEPTLLNELLSNLVDNALAHTPAGGNVILRVRHRRCWRWKTTGRAFRG